MSAITRNFMRVNDMSVFSVIAIIVSCVIVAFSVLLTYCAMCVSGRESRLEEENKNNGGTKDVP